MNALNVLRAQLTRDLFAIAKFLFVIAHAPRFILILNCVLECSLYVDKGGQLPMLAVCYSIMYVSLSVRQVPVL